MEVKLQGNQVISHDAVAATGGDAVVETLRRALAELRDIDVAVDWSTLTVECRPDKRWDGMRLTVEARGE